MTLGKEQNAASTALFYTRIFLKTKSGPIISHIKNLYTTYITLNNFYKQIAYLVRMT